MAKNYKNFLLCSLSGMLFSGSANNKSTEELTEEAIKKTIFNNNPIKKTKINPELFSGESYLDGFTEDILIYYSASTNDVWNYNPIISLHTGEIVYSSVILFVTESMLKGSKIKTPMDYNFFKDIVQGFIDASRGYIDQNQNYFEEETKEEEDISPRSKIYNLKEIAFHISEGYKIKVETKKHDTDLFALDSYYQDNYVQKYHSDFCYENLKLHDCINNKDTFVNVLIKPGLMAVIDELTGTVDNYFAPQFNYKRMSDLFKKINELSEEYTYTSKKFNSEDDKLKEFNQKKQTLIDNFYKEISC